MVYLVLSRQGYDQLIAASGSPPSPLWVSGGVLSETELSDLRDSGLDVTDFHGRIDPADLEEVAEAVDTIRLHHPDRAVWVESPYAA